MKRKHINYYKKGQNIRFLTTTVVPEKSKYLREYKDKEGAIMARSFLRGQGFKSNIFKVSVWPHKVIRI